MRLTERFHQLAQQQLASFSQAGSLALLVLYAAQGQRNDQASLEMVERWPTPQAPLPPAEADPALRTASPERRWYPLREGNRLLGALRAERLSDQPWSDDLDRRLQACASALAHSLSLDLERTRLIEQLHQQRLQLNVMVHQLRNPLAALRTYAQLLLRRLGPDSDHRALVEGLLQEQDQLNRYITALDQLADPNHRLSSASPTPLLLPPVLPNQAPINLKELLTPLVERAAATAALQGRPWHCTVPWPAWTLRPRAAADGVVAEIVANLMENAFRYSPSGAPLGLHFLNNGLCLWDGGPAIPAEERARIFERGVRGSSSQDRSGSGLGLALARQLAEERGGQLNLATSPQAVDHALPAEGNAFVLTLPTEAMQEPAMPAASS